jgi:lauroyl/myristoyl acyltransferase
MTGYPRIWVGSSAFVRRLSFTRQLCSLQARAQIRRAFWRYWVADVVMGLGSYALHYLLRLLPFDACSGFGAALGLLVGRLRGSHRPDLPARAVFARLQPRTRGKSDLDVAMKRMCANIGRVYAEYNVLDLLWSAGRITVTGQEHLAACRDRNCPIIVFGVHLTSWEVIGATLLGLGYNVYTLYRPAGNRFQDRIVVAVRLRGGAKLIPPGPRGARQAYRVLIERCGLFLTWVDEQTDGNARVPAFGREIRRDGNLAAMIRLANLTGAQAIPAYVERQRGAHFHTTFGAPVRLLRGGDETAAHLANLRNLDAVISSIILPRLEDWWMLPGIRFN